MIQITVYPKGGADVYSLLVKKEKALRVQNKGTFHRSGAKKLNEDKWNHSTYGGWIRFQRCIGGVLVAQVKSMKGDPEWQLLTAFVGFLHRHFQESVRTIQIGFED